MNKLLQEIKKDTNYTTTENGAVTHKSTLNSCLDLFAMGAALRDREENDLILMFDNAFKEDPLTAMRLAFWIRDIRGGQGERRWFRVVMKHMAKTNPNVISKNLGLIPEFGRWDDLYTFVGTPLEKNAMEFMHKQFLLDMQCDTPSLLGKWLKSENTSSAESVALARRTRKYFKLSSRNYRKSLSKLREKINIVETLMSQNRWDEIEFDKLPSKAGFIYKNAFARRDVVGERYKNFISSDATVNAGTLYPYEVVQSAIRCEDEIERMTLNKYWDNIADVFDGKTINAIAVVDTSGSMWGTPINVAISLGLYLAERGGGPFANHYISFSSEPQLIKTEGVDFVDKVQRIYDTNIVSNTNIEATFDLILKNAVGSQCSQEDLPQNIVIISDMEFDYAAHDDSYSYDGEAFTGFYKDNADTLLEEVAKKFNAFGYKMPHLIFWNVSSRQNNIPAIGQGNISYVSGFSPSIFSSIITGKTGHDLMMEVVNSKRYSKVTA